VEWVLGLNPHLAHLPLILPEGTVLFLPEKREESTKKEIKLWD
jgi:phage tail protein X